MNILEKLNKLLNFNKEKLLKYKAPSNAKWLTLWPTIKVSKNKTQIVLPVAPIVFGLLVVLVFVSWYAVRNQMPRVNTPEENMLGVIGQVIELPVETPQVAIVSNKELLTQEFFAQAENGDYVIVYQQANKVLLYRPSTKKVINFANVQIPQSETELFTRPN